MHFRIPVAALALCLGITGAARLAAAPPAAAAPDALRAELEKLRPEKLVWRDIAWRKCLLEGLRQAREQKKPVLLWAFINADPSEERC